MSKNIKKYLGVDWGEARIGLALGDDETKIATPFRTVKGLDELLKTAVAERIVLLVVGDPVSLSGQPANGESRFVFFLAKLKKRSPVPIELVDERLSSRAAGKLLRPAGRRGNNHAAAAMLILQTYFDRQKAKDENR